MSQASLAHLVPHVYPVFHRREIAATLRRLCADSELYWNAMPDEEFVAPLGSAWSPADNVRHLTTSVRAVTRGMRLPRLLLRVLFPGGRGVSRRYEAIVRDYRARLAAGGRAGRFAPKPETVPGDPAAYRRALLAAHRESVEALAAMVMQWTRTQVDGIQLPHPLLGRLTVREMLLFTVYHNVHHVRGVARRRGDLPPGT